MQISLRSHLIAGTAAVVGASAIAMTPVMGAQLSLPAINVPTVAKVTLAGLDSPISELLGSVILGGQLLLNAGPQNAIDPQAWGPSAFGTFTGNVFTPFPGAGLITGGLVASGLYLGGPGFDNGVGVLPQIIDDALPIIRQLGINGSDYLNVTVAALSAAGIALSEGVWNAAGALLTLDIPGALADLAAGISAAGTLALGAGAYVLSNVLVRAQAVFGVLSGNLSTLVEATVAQIGTVLQKVGQVVDDTVSAATFEGGWNAAIDGIFGATGIPGTVLNVTVGAGQVVNPATADQAFVPSTRTLVRGTVVAIADALTTTAPTTASSAAADAAPAAPAASAASARAAAVEAAPAAEAPAADSSEAAPAAEAAEA
ncbi:MAG: hypothetical protein NT156_15390, partial [Mycobacterium sp.]|nr:hypothetical protein [Mycobacterium sp.]